MAVKGMKTLLIGWFIAGFLANTYGNEKQELMIVKPLDVTISVRQGNTNPSWNSLSESAKYFMEFHKKKRLEKLTALVSRYQIQDPVFMLEWAGGLSPRYKVIIVTRESCFWTMWDPRFQEKEASGKCELSEIQAKTLYDKTRQLRHYEGETAGWIYDRTVIFMTFYEKNIPVYSFFSDVPIKNCLSTYSKQFTELDELRKYISANIVLLP